jgi:dihydrofolate synthase/folylpolyglutamate synthase
MITQEETAAGLSRLRDSTGDWDHQPTFFELSTVLALEHFERSGCDVVVLETGMGGRLDSTNVVTPLVSVITPIAMDHMLWLGDDIAKIAAEKAGIIKPTIPVVSSSQQPAAEQVLRARADECGSRIRFVDEPYPLEVALEGAHQLLNAAVAVAALKASGLSCDPGLIAKGLASVQWPARFQRVSNRIVIDGAHNEHSAGSLVSTWNEVFGDERASIVFGALKDKDYASMLRTLEKIGHRFFFVPVRSERSETPAALKALASLPSDEFHDLPGALTAALADAPRVLIAGSLFLCGEALGILGDRGQIGPV